MSHLAVPRETHGIGAYVKGEVRRDRGYADIDRPPASIASEAYDPKRSLAGPKSRTATSR